MRRNQKQITTYYILFSLLLIGVVYAILQANLQINGTAKIQSNTWDIHFDNIQVNEDSVPIGTGDSQATIDPENNCKVDFEVTLSIPGDFYEFTIDVVNAGTIDGMIGELNKTLKVNNEVVSEVPDYLNYSVTYSDGEAIIGNHKVNAGSTETYLVRLEFKTDIEELPEATTITTSLEPQYLQADSSAIVRPINFEISSWNRIIEAYNTGNISSLQTAMEAGTLREVQLDMDYNGTYETTAHVRIANLSTPAECSTTGFSQTACGFVIEFSDVITTHRFNPYNANYAPPNGYNNMGGWEYSDMRAFLNSTKYLEGQSAEIDYSSTGFYNALSSDLKRIIINTTAVSGFGSKQSRNFTTIDKIYLLSPHEIWDDPTTSPNEIHSRDTSYYSTRQLDYYLYRNVNRNTSYNSIVGKKNLNGETANWWLRSAGSAWDNYFYLVSTMHDPAVNSAQNMYGVSPSFRIAE